MHASPVMRDILSGHACISTRHSEHSHGKAVEAVGPKSEGEFPMAAKKKKKKAVKAKRSVKASKAKKPARKAAKAAKKSKVKKASKRPAARKAKKAAAKRPVAKKAVAKKSTAKKKAPARKARRDVIGEGNYTASREFNKEQTDFVKRNKAKIPEMGHEAEKALEGPEGTALRAAEDEARAHAHTPEE
jgi:histone H1/5